MRVAGEFFHILFPIPFLFFPFSAAIEELLRHLHEWFRGYVYMIVWEGNLCDRAQ